MDFWCQRIRSATPLSGSIRFVLIFLAALASPAAQALCTGAVDDRSSVCATETITLEALIARTNPGACQRISPKALVCSRRVAVDALKNTAVSGEGIALLFLDPRQGKGGLVFTNATNIAVSNFSIAWDGQVDGKGPETGYRRIFSFGTVESCIGASARIRVDMPDDGLAPVEAISIWNDQEGWPWRRRASNAPVERYFHGNRALKISDGATACTHELVPFTGQRLLLRHYAYANNALICRNCEGALIKEVSVHSAPGMAFLFWGGKDIALIRNKVAPACAPACAKAYPSAASDASHFGAVAGSIIVAENDFSMQGDDSVNITSWAYPGNVRPSGEEGAYDIQIDQRMKNRFWVLSAGQAVKIMDLGFKEIGRGQTTSVSPETMTVRLKTDAKLLETVVLVPLDRIASEVNIVRNRFHSHRARGILAQTGRIRIENNEISLVTMAAIMIGADTDYWFEGPGAESVLIKGNRIRQVNAAPYSKEYPSAISAGFVVDRNYKQSIGNPIGPITIEGNEISEVYSNPERVINFGAGLCCNRN
ncbi:MAG: hypothetical protein AB7I12_14925 [Steroidobacteraceae bacterium]